MTKKELLEKAKRKAKRLQKLRQDPRYLKTIGKLRKEGFLDARDVPEYRGQVFLEDALWTARLEPRVYELLPAIIARRPKCFVFFKLPEDLNIAVRGINRGQAHTPYQGVPAEKYSRWIMLAGRKSSPIKVMKSFRLDKQDLELLSNLSRRAQRSQTHILHEALVDYAKSSKWQAVRV